MDNSYATLLGALGGGLISGVTAFVINRQNKKTEEQKHLHSLVVNSALENWKQILQIAKEQKGVVLPLPIFIVNMLKACDLLLDKEVNKNNVTEKLRELDEFKEEISKYYKNKNIQNTQHSNPADGR